ncbi:tRNA-processing RNAse BN [Geothermobacter ehrlichii]|uniref:tRNA-processing RNAse BN n=1 Tax=Geothermobacter ehrlichii TaxID=213224 RepID=A0A5D3WJP7_9BACT|nr:YhjD/YihY/BrkB family envelope integrity protein [Geothermobacter ehrlichii]TYO98787.1 tRNA-processing RNAse BN [Geothermobacter ehrlichii]
MFQWVRDFFLREIWRIDPEGLNPGQRFLLRLGQVASRTVRDFVADRCLLRASALTYASMLSFVPLLALMFAVLKGLGVQNRLEPLLLEHIAVGSEEIVSRIVQYINNTNVGRLGTFGLVFLVMTVLTLLSNIEDSFNAIWYVRETRSLMRRFADYFSVVILGPIFLVLAVTMTASLESQEFILQLKSTVYVGPLVIFLFNVLPYIAMWAAFAFLYIFMPNIRVRLQAALIGGIVGGTLWQLTQWGYVNFQVGVARYNAIYGTMAALPIFMIWLYISWVIVLLGVEVTYAWQNLGSLRQDELGGETSAADRERVALGIMLYLGGRFRKGETPGRAHQIARDLGLPSRLVRNIIGQLVQLRLLVEVNDGDLDEAGYQPARALDGLRIVDFLRQIRGEMRLQPAGELPEELCQAERVEEMLDQAAEQALGGRTLADLIRT